MGQTRMRNDKPREPGYRPTDGSDHARIRQIDMDEDGAHYFYTLYPLSSGQAEEAEPWQATRGRYNDGRWVGRDEARHDRRWNGPALHGVEPLGWFTDGNPAFYPIRLHPPTDGQ